MSSPIYEGAAGLLAQMKAANTSDTQTPKYEFGILWAADGDSRPGRYREILAHVPSGLDGGVLLVESGAGGRRWLLVSEWDKWVSETNAAPVKSDPEPFPTDYPADDPQPEDMAAVGKWES